MNPARDMLEAAIIANPNDVAAHAAYADMLIEAGEPHGDFIRIQLALEDERIPPSGRRELRQRERESIPLAILADNETLTQLRRLLINPEYRGESSYGYEDVQGIASSNYLANVRFLQLRYSDLGDRMIRVLIKSGMLRRLKWLDLRHGNITDNGVRSLVESECTKRLQTLDLCYNRISPTGLDMLETLGCESNSYPQSRRRLFSVGGDEYESAME